jgi:hypothetical protein
MAPYLNGSLLECANYFWNSFRPVPRIGWKLAGILRGLSDDDGDVPPATHDDPGGLWPAIWKRSFVLSISYRRRPSGSSADVRHNAAIRRLLHIRPAVDNRAGEI